MNLDLTNSKHTNNEYMCGYIYIYLCALTALSNVEILINIRSLKNKVFLSEVIFF